MRFFVKRTGILYILLFGMCFLFGKQRIAMIVALTFGMSFALLRFAVLESVFGHLYGAGKKRAVITNLVIYLLNIVIIATMVMISMHYGLYTLVAALAGTFSIMIIVIINAVTEAFGITKNQFGQKVK